MRISKRGEYAMRSLIDLAMAHAMDRGVVPLSALAETQNIPAAFLEQILVQLKREGILKSVRGKYGGYSLAKSAKEIMMGDLVRMIDGPLAPIGCASQSAYTRCTCPDEAHCGLRLLMIDVRQAISNVMDKYSLEQVAAVALSKLHADNLEPEVVHQIRHMSLVERSKKLKKFVPLVMEPDFTI
jgi:Rrf2 family protein